MTSDQKTEFRHTVLAVLAIRHPAALATHAIRRAILREGVTHFEAADLDSALEILKGLGWASSLNDPLGSGLYWSATAQGVLEAERRGEV